MRPTNLLYSLLLLGLGFALCTVFNAGTIQSLPLVIPLDGQRSLIGRLYLPKTTAPPFPVMVLCHGVSSTKEVMAPLAVELARRGSAALVFDFGGYGESYPRPDSDDGNLADARAVVAFVRSDPERFLADRIGIGGHSMGGTATLGLATEDRSLRAAIVLGMSGPAGPAAPRNLLLGIGLYEEFHPVREMRAMLQLASGKDPDEFRLSGDFAAGTARMLVVSPTADHLIEPYDPLIIGQAVSWAARALGLPADERPLVVPWYIAGLLAVFGGGLALFVSLFLRTAGRVSLPGYREFHRRFVPFLIMIMLGVVWSLGASGLGPKVRAANLMLFFYVLHLTANYALLYPKKIAPCLRVVGLYALVFLGAFALTALVNAGGLLLAHAGYLVKFPQFLIQWPVDLLYNHFHRLRAFLFPAYSLELRPSYLFLLLVLLDLMRPGITLVALERCAAWAVTALRQPITWTWSPSWRSAALLSGLGVLLTGIVYQRWQAGLLSAAAGSVALRVVGQHVLLPLLLVVLVLRSPRFQRLEIRLLQPSF